MRTCIILISNFRRVLNVVCFLLGNSPASEFRRLAITQKKAYNVNKGPTRCNSMQTFIHCHVTLHVSGVMHPPSGVLKTVSATSGVRHGNGTVTSFLRGLIRRKEVTVPLPWRTPEVTDTVFSTPDDGCMTPETCRVTWQWINVCILLHRVGPLLTLNHDAWNHEFKMENFQQYDGHTKFF